MGKRGFLLEFKWLLAVTYLIDWNCNMSISKWLLPLMHFYRLELKLKCYCRLVFSSEFTNMMLPYAVTIKQVNIVIFWKPVCSYLQALTHKYIYTQERKLENVSLTTRVKFASSRCHLRRFGIFPVKLTTTCLATIIMSRLCRWQCLHNHFSVFFALEKSNAWFQTASF